MTIKRVRPVDRDKAVGYYNGLLYALGYDTKSDLAMNAEASGRNTAQRAVDAYIEFFSKEQDHFHFTTFTNGDAKGMVVAAQIEFASICAHHFLPYTGVAHVGYIPDESVCGLSKIIRAVDHYSHRPSIQEDLTSRITKFMWEQLEPKGCGVVIAASHGCMSIRGVTRPGHVTVTSDARGCFEDAEIRAEFKALIAQAQALNR